jgi:hypothetical protein
MYILKGVRPQLEIHRAVGVFAFGGYRITALKVMPTNPIQPIIYSSVDLGSSALVVGAMHQINRVKIQTSSGLCYCGVAIIDACRYGRNTVFYPHCR